MPITITNEHGIRKKNHCEAENYQLYFSVISEAIKEGLNEICAFDAIFDFHNI